MLDNNNKIANKLEDIASSLSELSKENISNSLIEVKKNIKQLDILSKDLGASEVRALAHWMMLNIELDDNKENEEKIISLLENGCYYKWMGILSNLLKQYDPSLLPEIYKSLTSPRWIVNPSAPLLRDLAKWIESTKQEDNSSKANTDENISQTSRMESTSHSKLESENSSQLEFVPTQGYEEVELTVLEKNYCGSSALDKFSGSKKTEDDLSETQETENYYTEIIATDERPTKPMQAEEAPVAFSEKKQVEAQQKTETPADTRSDDTLLAEDTNDFNLEVSDIIMSLTHIGTESKNVFNVTDQYINELERLEMLAEISGYPQILPVSRWCRENLTHFSKNQSNESRLFIQSGECWTWIELINLALDEPEDVSHISELSTALTQENWEKPLNIDHLQDLLLFLRHPEATFDANMAPELVDTNDATKDSDKATTDVSSNNTSTSHNHNGNPEYKLSWDEDVHPELLAVYFEETSSHIKETAQYLKNIKNTKTTKEERQNAARTAHTIKGGSAVVGITALSELAYKLEQILDHSIQHELSSETQALLIDTSSCLEDLYKAINEKKDEPESLPSILSKLTHFIDSIEEDDLDDLELNAPALPDFITQQNAETKESGAKDDIQNNVDETSTNDNEEFIEITLDKKHPVAKEGDTHLPTIENPTSSAFEADLSDFSAELDDIVMTLVTIDVEQGEQLKSYTEELQRLDMLAEISGFTEVSNISNWCQSNLESFYQNPTNESREFISSGSVWSWIELISACLSDPEETSHISELSNELSSNSWIEPVDAENLQALLLLLKRPSQNTESEKISTRISNDIDQAKFDAIELSDSDTENNDDIVVIKETQPVPQLPEGVITWDQDVHPELLSVYLQETSEQVSSIAELLHKISKGSANKEQQEQAARIAHTIKGASGVVGINELVDFTHKLEDILDYSVNNKLPDDIADLLAESSDCLESLFEAVQAQSAPPEEYAPVLKKLSAYAKQITGDANAEESAESANAKATTKKPIIDAETIDITQEAIKASNKANQSNSLSTVDTSTNALNESHIRVPVALINRLLNLAGELVTTSSQVSDKVENSLSTSLQIKEQDKRVHNMLNELSSTIIKQEKDQLTLLSSLQNQQFDTLEMDTYNELHSITGLLTESILDSEAIENTLNGQLKELHDDLRTLDHLNKELSETILNSRMESLNTLIPRLERIVRQTCRKTKKKAELLVTGNDINIDTEILNGLVDPLLHLLRNAVDHGIETSAVRKKKKKDKVGQIHLDFSRRGNFIHMQLKDDGAGINSEKIYQHAIDKGLITPDQEYSKSEVLKLILQPGFSTHKSVTDISGRGVGMDIVNDGVKQLKGTLQINSELGQGTTFDIKIPLTLVTSSTLLVKTAGNQVAIPTDSIDQLFYLSPEDVLLRKGQQHIRHQGKELVIKSLAGILSWPVKAIDFTQAQTLMLVKGDNEIHAVHIDEIIHSREVVIKSLAHFIDDSKGVIGACHLTDGQVAPVLNLPQLLNTNETQNYVIKQAQDTDIDLTETKTTPQILVVDDSLSNRKALSLIIEKTEYDVITAVDGLDALNVMNEKHIDLVFTDLEMPRMTGLELAQAIRAWDEKKHTPIIMITSRSTKKHRELAKKAGVDDYLTKPVATDTLLASLETWLKQEALS